MQYVKYELTYICTSAEGRGWWRWKRGLQKSNLLEYELVLMFQCKYKFNGERSKLNTRLRLNYEIL